MALVCIFLNLPNRLSAIPTHTRIYGSSCIHKPHASASIPVLRGPRGRLVGRCVRDFCDRLGFIMENHEHDGSSYRANRSHRSDTVLVSQTAHDLIRMLLAPNIS